MCRPERRSGLGLAGSLAILVPVAYVVYRVLEWLQPAMVAAFWTGLVVAVAAAGLVVRHVMRYPLVNRFAYRQRSRADVELDAAVRQPELDAEQRRALSGKVVQGVVLSPGLPAVRAENLSRRAAR